MATVHQGDGGRTKCSAVWRVSEISGDMGSRLTLMIPAGIVEQTFYRNYYSIYHGVFYIGKRSNKLLNI